MKPKQSLCDLEGLERGQGGASREREVHASDTCVPDTCVPDARPAQSTERGPDWRRFLAAGTAREVLARIVDGDPLQVRRRVSERLRSRHLLLEGERVSLRVLSRVARAADRYRGRPALDDWLLARCDEAIEDVLREEAEAVRRGEQCSRSAFVSLATPLGLDPQEMRSACVLFNDLPPADRSAFHAIVLERRSLEDVARAADVTTSTIARRARRALDLVMNPNNQEMEELS